jgi:hypothetical protein
MNHYLGLSSASVNDIHIDAIIDQLLEELLSPLFRLHKDQHRWSETLLKDIQNRERLSIANTSSPYV